MLTGQRSPQFSNMSEDVTPKEAALSVFWLQLHVLGSSRDIAGFVPFKPMWPLLTPGP